MPLPSEQEVRKSKEKLHKLLIKLNPDGSPKRSVDDNLAKNLMRNAVRKNWMYCPTKISFLLMNRLPNNNLLEGKARWVYQCNKCKGYFRECDVEVDHIKGEISFVEWNMAQPYASSILDVSHNDLQLLCIPDHKTKSRCEQLGLDWNTDEGWTLGLKEQEFTRVMNSKAKGQREFISKQGQIPAKNEENRALQIRSLIFK